MKTQNQIILSHLKRYGKIHSWTAIVKYHITRLSGRIYDLREQGIKIQATKKKVHTMLFGDVMVAEYRLVKE